LTDKRLSYHFDANDAPKLVPARVHYEKENGRWQLQLLTGTTPLRINEMPEVQYAAWVHRYWPIKPSNTLEPDPTKPSKFRPKESLLKRILAFRASRARGKERKVLDLEHGFECFALLKKFDHPHPEIKFWDLVEISKDEKKLRAKVKGENQRVEKGWLCLNNQNIESKHSERFFFRAKDNRTGPTEIELPPKIREDYEALIQDYQERHAKEVEERREARGHGHDHELWPGKDRLEPALSRFVYRAEEKKLQGGELVYAWLTGPVHAPEVKFIVPVSVPRVMFENSIQKLLPHERLHRCKNSDELCPACRTFGWVRGERNEEGAYASRVRFSHATATNLIKFKNEILLAILSSPKPTTTRFYLVHKSWQSKNRNAKLAGYDNGDNVLRGRKFYRHFGTKLDSKEYTRATDAEHNGKDEQNRTLRGTLDKGSEFTFTVRFENLAPVELGALLWSLEMDARGVHRLGLAKPLGFGSVRIQIDDSQSAGLQLLDAKTHYAADSWLLPAYRGVLAQGRQHYVWAFKRAMVKRFAWNRAQSIHAENDSAWDAAFESLDNIADLRAMLNDPPANLAIHYPRLDPEPLPDGENFKWFMANNREAGRKQGLLLELEVPAEEVKNRKGLALNPAKF
jgi:CRISPR-associated protein (TIGR03986 family)